MKQYSLKIRSKNEKSLRYFLYFFSKHLKTRFNIIQKSITSKTNRKIVTLLKSPHVNKTAQEHFEAHLFTNKMLVKSAYLEKNFIFLKKTLTKLFQDISVWLEFASNNNLRRKNGILTFSSDNLKLSRNKSFKTNLKRCKQKIVSNKLSRQEDSLFHLMKLLNTVSIFGEVLLTSSLKVGSSLNSSAVEQRTENPCVGSSNLSSDKKKPNYEELSVEYVYQHQKWTNEWA